MAPDASQPNLDSALAALEPGFLVGAGRFTLVRLISRGGMGVVWLARDESLREEVALKFLPSEIRYDAVALDDLRRETSRSRKLTHPNIIRIYDLYRDDREAFISMEYVDGPNLTDLRIEQGDRTFPWSFVQPLVKQLCEALDYAHGEGVIHRDLKPANMMLDRRARLKLADFGIAAVFCDSVSRISMRHATSGTVTHMSPQQMDGRMPQPADDIYALGATLYELLTSRPPFYTGDIAHQVRTMAATPINERLEEFELKNSIPPAVAAMIMACLSKDPAQRPATVRAVAEWIGLQGTSTASLLTHTSASTAESMRAPERTEPEPKLRYDDTAAVETVAAEPSTRRKRTGLFATIGAVILIGLAVLAFTLKPWVREKNAPLKSAPAEPWIALFDGTNLDLWEGWNGADWNRSWALVDGELVSVPGVNVSLATREVFGNFELEFKWKVSPRANSGILYRAVAGASEVWQRAPEYQIVDDAGHRDGNDPITATGAMFGVAAAATKTLNGAGEYNTGRIVARGTRIEHWLNGTKVLEVNLLDPAIQQTAFAKFRKSTWGEAVQGRIVLQHMGHRVSFRDLRIRRLPD
jgi:serine/threonine protein kinase